MTRSNNPLLISSELPLFSDINAVHVTEAVRKVLTNCYNIVDRIASRQHCIKWDELYYPLMIAENKLQRIWSPIVHLNSVRHNVTLRKVYEKNLLYISEYRNWVSQHSGLYKVYRSLRNNDVYQQLSVVKRKALDNILYNFELSGVCLSRNQKRCYKYIHARLAQLGAQYSNNVLDASSSWNKLITDRKILSGIPDYKLRIASSVARARGQEGWLLTLQNPIYSSVLRYCDTDELREELYWAFRTRASDQGPNYGRWDNTAIMDEILTLRHELARILGFNTYLEKSLATKMVQCPKQVFDFLINLCNHIRDYEHGEFLRIQNFARKYYYCNSVKPWDIEYYVEKQKQYFFPINNEELCGYFPEKRVLDGIFLLMNYIYGLFIKERNGVNTWHTDVRFFDIFDEKNEWRGGFYLDLYARDGKREGAWMDEFVSKMYKIGTFYKRPIAYLTCNFDPHRDEQEQLCLLSHNEIVILFHEFGHVLHHIMTSVDIPEIAGIHGVPWDAVELSSQFMEKFCWDPDVLKLIAMHFQTEEPLPDCVINNLLKTKTYQASSNILRQVIYGLFDLRIHHEYIPGQRNQVLTIFTEIIKKMSAYPIVEWDRFPNAFMHVFSDDYAAGYYSYLWSDMLASNVWDCFQNQNTLLNIRMGRLFLDNILALGGSIDLFKSLTQFCGRTLTIEPMLKYYGIPVSGSLPILM